MHSVEEMNFYLVVKDILNNFLLSKVEITLLHLKITLTLLCIVLSENINSTCVGILIRHGFRGMNELELTNTGVFR